MTNGIILPGDTVEATPPTDPDLWPSRSPSFTKVAAAFAKAQGAIEHAAKDNENSHFKNKYADLAGVIDAYRTKFAENGLSVLQPSLPCDARGIRIQTIILHESGEWIADRGLYMPAGKADAQGMGSALTYARRYAMAALVGVAQDDDDGNAASATDAPAARRQTAPAKSVKLAKKSDRDALQERIVALPETLGGQVRARMKAEGVVWTKLDVDQYAMVAGWVDTCEAFPVEDEPAPTPEPDMAEVV